MLNKENLQKSDRVVDFAKSETKFQMLVSILEDWNSYT